MLTRVGQAIDALLPESARSAAPEELRQFRIVAAFAVVFMLLGTPYAALYYWAGSCVSAAIVAVALPVCISVLLLLRWTASCQLTANIGVGALFLILTAVSLDLGGPTAPPLLWYALVPVVAVAMAGRRSAAIWTAVTLVSLIGMPGFVLLGLVSPTGLDAQPYSVVFTVVLAGLVLLIAVLTQMFDGYKEQVLTALRRERDFSDSTVDSLPGIFYLFDETGRLLRWNKNFERVSGYSSEEIGRMHPREFLVREDRERLENAIRTAFVEGEASVEAMLLSRDGSAAPYVFTGKRVVLDGRTCVVGMGIDITERRRAENELRESNTILAESLKREKRISMELEAAMGQLEAADQEVRAANRAKSEFLANMSHEIRTPMTAILGFADGLVDGGFSEAERHEAVQTIQRNGQHLLQVIEDILDVSKIEDNKLEIERIRFSPADVVADVKAMMADRARKKGLVFEAAYAGRLPATIESDPTRLRQILVNLVGNAIKFTERGSVRVVASMNLKNQRAAMLRFDVIDTGIGMTPEEQGRLFQPFTQADSSMTRRFGGTGLGLTISKRLAEMLGGHITVQSRSGEGSTFSVTIDVGPADALAFVGEPADVQAGSSNREGTNGEEALSGCRVLLAEDGPDNRRLISYLLTKAGASAAVVEDGQQAVDAVMAAAGGLLDKSGDVPFHVVLMDMQMPTMDGYEATRLLRERGYVGPIIALTAHAMATDRQKCMEAGCDDYIAKPIDRDGLVAMIGKHARSVPVL